MYDLKPKGVFAHRRVFDNPRAVARMERMLDALGMTRADVPVVDLADVDAICELAGTPEGLATDDILGGGHGRFRQGHLKVAHDPVIVFNTFVWDEADRTAAPRELRNPHAKRLQAIFCGVGENFSWSRRWTCARRSTGTTSTSWTGCGRRSPSRSAPSRRNSGSGSATG